MEVLDQFIEGVKGLNVLVIGETISDVFIRVKYEGHSMKSFCPVFKIEDAESLEVHEGGALAIANHLKDFVSNVDLVSNMSAEIVKTRYIDINSKQKHVEINHFNAKPHADVVHYGKYDVIIVADFGHGFCNDLDLPDGVHIMCQTNSNNFGFNRVSKWKRVKKASVCIDLREASLQLNKKVKLDQQDELIELYNYEIISRDLYVTLGNKGAVYTDGVDTYKHESYSTNVVDTIGAGDAFFAFASLASHLSWKQEKRLTVPSLAASLTTTWLANEKCITKNRLLNHAAKRI